MEEFTAKALVKLGAVGKALGQWVIVVMFAWFAFFDGTDDKIQDGFQLVNDRLNTMELRIDARFNSIEERIFEHRHGS